MAATNPDKTALLVVSDPEAPPERWSYAEIDEAVRLVAAGLRSLGLPPGTRIMIRMENTSDYALMYFGAIAAGLVALPSSSQLSATEAAFLLADSEAAVLAVSDELRLNTTDEIEDLGRLALARSENPTLPCPRTLRYLDEHRIWALAHREECADSGAP